jgi:hypothetical protein
LVIIDDINTAELSESLHKHSEDKAPAVAGPVEEVCPARHVLALFEPQLLAHLMKFRSNGGIVLAVLCIQTFNHCKGFVVALLFKQPSRGVWEPENTDEDDQRGKAF